MRTNADLTIYNKYIDPNTRAEAWQRKALAGTRLPAVVWESSKGSRALSVGLQAADQATIYIPFMPWLTSAFVEAVEWLALEDKEDFWTLKSEDIVVKGLVTDELTAVFTAKNLRNKYSNALVITSVDRMDSGSLALQHWQVGAK